MIDAVTGGVVACLFLSGGTLDFSAWINKWIFQFTHVGWGGFLTLALQLHFWWGFLAVVAFAAVKEFVFDPLTKSTAPCGSTQSDRIDFLFFGIGVALGLIARYV